MVCSPAHSFEEDRDNGRRSPLLVGTEGMLTTLCCRGKRCVSLAALLTDCSISTSEKSKTVHKLVEWVCMLWACILDITQCISDLYCIEAAYLKLTWFEQSHHNHITNLLCVFLGKSVPDVMVDKMKRIERK